MTAIRGQHLIGKVIGSCVLEKMLGYGGSSAVFLARQQRSVVAPERKVAVKVFLPRAGIDDHMRAAFYERFLSEAKAVSRLEHANILPIYAYGEEEGLPYIVMPYMPGGTLGEYMSKRGPLSLQEASWYLQQLADALDYAHKYGCVHCDVKPANILLDREGYAMLSDFGIARIIRDQADEEQSKRRSEDRHQEVVLGTPDYISPEQAQMHPLDGRSDVYSLGVTLFYVLTRQLPFHADTPITLALLHVYEPAPSLMLLRADITPALDRVILKALAKQPIDRYQTAGEFSEAFTQALSDSEKHKAFAHIDSHIGLSDDDLLTGPQPVMITRPIVRVRPRMLRPARDYRLLFISLVICIILTTVCLSFSFMAHHPQSTHLTTLATPHTTVPTPTLLADSFVHDWPQGSGQGSGFSVDRQQHYHIVNNQMNAVAMAFYQNHLLQNFQLSVNVLEIKASDVSDYQGVVFRASADEMHYYLFEIAPRDKSYEFLRCDNNHFEYISAGNLDFPLNAGKENILVVSAQGNAFQFSVNGHAVTSEPMKDKDAPLKAGLLGLYLENKGEVAFSHLLLHKR
ncbi:serine/threonine protein kinase [Ktedonobacteria bacterium brp13]|nr:serine/threonine protein kinase [Ktedonobacteria bacterium brp13]